MVENYGWLRTMWPRTTGGRKVYVAEQYTIMLNTAVCLMIYMAFVSK